MIRLLVSIVAVALIQVLTWAPHIVRALWQLLYAFVCLSCVVYRAVFTRLADTFGLTFMVRQPWRTMLSMGVSVMWALVLGLVLGWSITLHGLVAASVHGLIVGAAWDALGVSGGQSLGR